jgi:lipid-A-disaccharide synthase
MIAARVPAVQFVVARAPHLDTSLFEPLGEVVGSGGRAPVIVESQADDVIAASDVVLVASGTATIQAAIHERPMVVVYRVSPLTYLARGLLQVDTFGMVNLVAGRQIVPELIQDDFQPEAVAEEAVRFLTDSTYVARTRSELRTVRHKLGDSGASRRVAEAILNIARRRREMKK